MGNMDRALNSAVRKVYLVGIRDHERFWSVLWIIQQQYVQA